MKLRQLQCFQVVARELNVTRAAELLHMAQPPLSRQIRGLEDELGVALFVREGRALKLTDAGRFLLEQSLQVTTWIDEIAAATRAIGQQRRSWFGIGFVPCTEGRSGSQRAADGDRARCRGARRHRRAGVGATPVP